MLRGDISNQRSFVFGFRVEGSLMKFKDDGLWDKVLNIFKGRFNRADVDSSVLSLMKHIYWDTEYTVMLVIDQKNYTPEAEEFFSSFPFNQVSNVSSPYEVSLMLNTGEMSYYIDDCDESRGLVNSSYAMTSEQAKTLLRRVERRV